MKKGRIITILIVLSVIISLIYFYDQYSIPIAENQELKLTIKLNQNKFEINSSKILLEVTMKNLYDDIVYIEKGFELGDNLYLELTLPDNTIIEPAIDYVDKLPKKVKLSDEKRTTIILDDLFFDTNNPTKIYDWNLTGNYSVKMHYRSYYMKDTIYSNSVEFDLI